jgi:hypothetical protein
MDDLGFPNIQIRDPSQAAFAEIVATEKKNPDNRMLYLATQVKTYFAGVVGATEGLRSVPKKDEPITVWKAWTAEAPSKAVNRILIG